MSEIEEIRQRFERRKQHRLNDDSLFPFFIRYEREMHYLRILRKNFAKIEDIKILEIGAGSGDNLLAFKRFGIKWDNIYANELLEERVAMMKDNIPNANILPGDALELDFVRYFDIILQSTVFTSILDYEFKKKLADKMTQMVKEDGLLLWYDFKYNNPKNPDVRGIKKAEIKRLFPMARRFVFHSATLAPPIGRRIGGYYNILNSLPFLRTHIIAEIYFK